MTCRGLNLNMGHFGCFTFIFVSCGESCLLFSWCAGGRCGMAGSDEDHGRSWRPGAEDRGWSHRSGTRWPDDREVGWRCLRSAPCTIVCVALVSWLSLKTMDDGLSVVWPQNHWDDFSRFGLKTCGDSFSRFSLKIDGGFPGLGLKTDSYGLVIWASKPSGLRFVGCTTKPMGGWRRRGACVEI
jgi:hypothetical protein